MALEQIGTGKGKRTGRRVICTEPIFKVEVSFEERGTILGAEGMNIGTYVSQPKPDGSLYGTAEGVFATPQGDIVTWAAMGSGKLAADGSVRYKGSIHYKTTSAKLAALNSVNAIFDFSTDAEGNSSSTTYDWK